MERKWILISSVCLLSGCVSLHTSPDAEHVWKPIPEPKAAEEELMTSPLPTFNAYSLPALIELGLSRNPQTRVAWWNAKKVLSQAKRAQAPFFPSLTVTAAADRTQVGATAKNPTSVADTWGPGLKIAYRLFQFGADKAGAKSAACALSAANYRFNFTLQQTVFQIQNAYYQYAAASERIAACKSSLEDAETSYQAAENRMKSGLGRMQSTLLAKAEKMQAEYELKSAEANVENCRADLALAVGVPISKDFQIEVSFQEVKPLTDEVQTLLEEALKNRADLLAQKAAVQAADWAYLKTKRERYPSIELSSSLNRLHHENKPHWQNNYNVQLGIAWNFFDGMDKQYKALEQHAERKAQQFALQRQQLEILRDVWTEFHAFQSAVQLLDSAKALETSAQESLQSARIGYQSGLNALLDVLSAQKTLSDARFKRIQSQADLAIHWARLAYVSGRIQPESSSFLQP
ncbi:MAG: TolC family protein [Opitutales bacterium]|nr:TolC family protein [Opitutales bacterium]